MTRNSMAETMWLHPRDIHNVPIELHHADHIHKTGVLVLGGDLPWDDSAAGEVSRQIKSRPPLAESAPEVWTCSLRLR